MLETLKDTASSLPGVALTILCWGTYGAVFHKGTVMLGGDRLKPLICVGIAYMVIGVVVPVAFLVATKSLGSGWTTMGTLWSLAAGVCGAVGALGIILAFTFGGKPIYVMPLVFGCAPLVNVVMSSYFAGASLRNVSPLFYAGMTLLIMGAAMVLIFQPKSHGPAHPADHAAQGADGKPEPRTGPAVEGKPGA